MTKKDYILIANAIKASRTAKVNEGIIGCNLVIDAVVDNLVDLLIVENPRFNILRFTQACE